MSDKRGKSRVSLRHSLTQHRSVGGDSGEEEEEGPPSGSHPKRKAPRNRTTKTSIEFDPEKRRQFLTGFRRRKEERRRKAREKIHMDAREEVRRAREDARKRAREIAEMRGGGGTSSSHRVVPEIEHLLPQVEKEEEEKGEVRDFGSHTVSVTHLGSLAIVGKEAGEENEAEEGAEEKEEEGSRQAGAASTWDKKALKMANRFAQKRLMSNKAYR